MLAVPFSAVGAIWLLWLLDYNVSIAVWVGLIALAGLDAETGVFMLLFLDLAHDEARARGRLRTTGDLVEAIIQGAVKRVRPKAMTVAAAFAGLLPIMWSTETGSDLMKRIAAPMVGGLVTSFLLELLVYPTLLSVATQGSGGGSGDGGGLGMTRRSGAKGRKVALVAGLALLVATAGGSEPRMDRGIEAFQEITSPAPAGSAQPRLSLAPSGRVLLSWLEQRPAGGHRLRMAWRAGKRWSKPVTIAEGDSFFANWADFPSVRPLDERRLIAHWLWKVSGATYGYHVRTASSSDGGRTWSTGRRLHRDETPTEHGFVSLVSSAGGATAVWLDGHNFQGHEEGHDHAPGPDMAVHAARWTDAGFGEEQTVDPRACECCGTAAVMTSRGVLVAYRDRSAEEIRDISVARFEDGRWTEPSPVHRDGWKIEGCPVNGPALAAAGDRVAIGWFTSAGDTARVNVAFSADGGARFGSPIRVDLGEPSGRVAIALLPDHSALVAWLDGTKDQAAIQCRRVASDGAKSEPWVLAPTSSGRSSGFPQLVVSEGRGSPRGSNRGSHRVSTSRPARSRGA
jgi:hypothetical protein